MSTRRTSSRVAATKASKVSKVSKVTVASVNPSTTTPSPVPPSGTDLPIIHFPSASAFSTWLEANHDTSPGLFLRIAKKNAGISSATYDSALDVALTWGWIDGQRRTCPDDGERFFLQRFTRRRKGSLWSKRNVGKITKLTEEGKMEAPGLEEVEKAKMDGRWERAYEGQKAMVVPKDLIQALEENQAAKKVFESLDKGKKYVLVMRLENAKKTETRGRRIDQLVNNLVDGKTT